MHKSYRWIDMMDNMQLQGYDDYTRTMTFCLVQLTANKRLLP